jgi:cysteine desulfurase/selenocysteine lyase
VKVLDCDFLVFSGHKLYGPTGVGVLFVKQELFKECKLSNFGGGIAYSVTPTHTEFKDFPHVLEPGTQAIAQVIGLAAAIDFVQKNINFDQVQRHETELVIKLATALQKCPNIVLISPIPYFVIPDSDLGSSHYKISNKNQHCNMVTFCVNGCHAYDVAEHLDKFGIAVRAGFHCVQPYHDKLGGNATVRVSFSAYNTYEQVDFLIECLKKMYH